MKVTPLDIRRKEFKRSVRGYLEEDVDVFLDTVADEVERLSKENTEMEERLKTLEEQVAGHSHIREALEKTLVAAQLQSEEIRTNAEKESQSILQDAESKARAVVEDLYSQTRKVQQTLMQLKLLEEDFRFKFRALLEGYLKLVEDSPILLSGLQKDMKAAGAPEGAASPPPLGGDAEDPTSETTEVSAMVAEADQAQEDEPAGPESKKGKGSKGQGDSQGDRETPPESAEGDGLDSEVRDFKW